MAAGIGGQGNRGGNKAHAGSAGGGSLHGGSGRASTGWRSGRSHCVCGTAREEHLGADLQRPRLATVDAIWAVASNGSARGAGGR